MNNLNVKLIPTTITDYPTVQNMARFYVYDRTKYMDWECPETGLYECIDFKHYFETPGEHAYLIRVNDELAGFVLLDQMQLTEPCDWNMGEFFIVAKFQSHGVGSQITREIFRLYPGKWSVAAMPENLGAVKFWRKIIKEISKNQFSETFKTTKELTTPDNPDPYPMIIWHFNTTNLNLKNNSL